VVLEPPAFRPPWEAPPQGPLVAPGRYSAELKVVSASGVRSLGAAQSFEVKPVPNLPPGTDPAAVAAFQGKTAEAARRLASASAELGRLTEQLKQMRATLGETPRADLALYAALDAVAQAGAELAQRLEGDPARQKLNEPQSPSIGDRIWMIRYGHWQSRLMPTATQRQSLEVASAALDALERDLRTLLTGDLVRLEEAFAAAGAPWTPGRSLPAGRPR
jgi:hypothetical protein